MPPSSSRCHSTSRVPTSLRPRDMGLIYLPKPSDCWRHSRYTLPHSSRWPLKSASRNIPNLLECLELWSHGRMALSLQAVAVLDSFLFFSTKERELPAG